MSDFVASSSISSAFVSFDEEDGFCCDDDSSSSSSSSLSSSSDSSTAGVLQLFVVSFLISSSLRFGYICCSDD